MKWNNNEIQQLKNRLKDLANRSYRQNLYCFTGFLGLGEQECLWDMEKELCGFPYQLWGGYEQAERKVVRFGSKEELGYEEDYPIACIHIAPLQARFAQDLSHRDFLGALMNLGIERSTLGDIRVGEKEAYLYCLSNMAEYICEHLNQVRHTSVRCDQVKESGDVPLEEPRELAVQVPSLRIDVCLAKVYNRSRGEILEAFQGGRVYVDGRLCENNARQLKGGETVNLRGYGKFVFTGEQRETRKGKLSVKVLIYM
ncbi:MAG: YlmH/Sll1252 family protein [bacterium]|nr:YlmH/Sll1252 family protein [bacterium]MCM1375855.1 YlmH/Sll1252 family protein [Muribaculum sp.]